jgi:hypothetical protein
MKANSLWELLRQPVPERLKWVLFYSAWAVVVLVMNPKNLLVAPLFPVGLLAVFPGGEQAAVMFSMLVVPGLLGWILYAALSMLIARTRKIGTFFPVYLVLCVVLALNVVGCKKTLEAAAGIQ